MQILLFTHYSLTNLTKWHQKTRTPYILHQWTILVIVKPFLNANLFKIYNLKHEQWKYYFIIQYYIFPNSDLAKWGQSVSQNISDDDKLQYKQYLWFWNFDLIFSSTFVYGKTRKDSSTLANHNRNTVHKGKLK